MAGVGEVLTLVGCFVQPAINEVVKDFIKNCISYLGRNTAKELDDLETTLLPEIKITIEAAQHSSSTHRAELDGWLRLLNNAYIEAKDILQQKNSKQNKKKLLERLLKLKQVAADSKRLRDLLVTPGNIHLKSSSSFLTNRVFGRDDYRDDIVNFLLDEQGGSSSGKSDQLSLEKSYSVVAITGVKSVGKTTVIQYVFNDERIKNYFPVRMWLDLSPDLNTTAYTKQMIESVLRNECPNICNLSVLQNKLKEILSESHNTMIVLDDVWYDNSNRQIGEQQWDCLLAPFVSRKGICKIVATSRSTLFPSALLPVKCIRLPNLELADFRSLLRYHAIDGLQSSNPQLTNNLIDRLTSIVDQIAEKMSTMGKQLLEAKALGNYLRQHPDIEVWENTLDHDCVF